MDKCVNCKHFERYEIDGAEGLCHSRGPMMKEIHEGRTPHEIHAIYCAGIKINCQFFDER